MNRLLSGASAVFLSIALTSPGESTSTAKIQFESAELLSATDVPYPVQSIAIGTVVLEVIVSQTGEVEDIRTIRDIPSLTDVAVVSVKQWHFKPASLKGEPVRSRTTVAVTFNPAALPATSVPLPPLSGSGPSRSLDVQPEPIDVAEAVFPQYPANSVTTGTVVLRVTISGDGQVENTKVVRKIPSLTTQCIRAIEDWKFKPAQLQGRPLRSSIGLAFVLRPPASAN